MNRIKSYLDRYKKWLYFSLASAFLWGFVTHGYCFVDNNLSHDSLNEFNGGVWGDAIKLGSGRMMTLLYKAIFRGDVTVPWLIGLLALLWIGLSVFLVIRLFRIEKKTLAFLIAGILTANTAVSSTAATYIHDLDCYMFALLCSVAAVCCWRVGSRYMAVGALLITIALGIYQAYITVTITLVMFLCILDILSEKDVGYVFSKGVKAIGMLLAGGILYYVLLQLTPYIFGVELSSGQYNSLDRALGLTPRLLAALLVFAYRDWFRRLLGAYSAYPDAVVIGSTVVLLVIFAVTIVNRLRSKAIHIRGKALCICLIALLPMCMNLLFILTRSSNHDLMTYAIWLFYLLVLLITDRFAAGEKPAEGKQGISAQYTRCTVCALLIGVLLYGQVQFANGMYMKKDLEYDANLSLMTRVAERMEAYDEYVPGETPVVFVGLPENQQEVIPGFEDFRDVTGLLHTDVFYLATSSRYQAYFEYVLATPIAMADSTVWEDTLASPSVQEMPCYPREGCVAMLDGTLVVKLGQMQSE